MRLTQRLKKKVLQARADGYCAIGAHKYTKYSYSCSISADTRSLCLSGAISLLVVMVVLAFGPSTALAAEKITLLTWGGAYSDTFKKIGENFEKETGIAVEVQMHGSTAAGLQKLIAQKNNPQIDVWTSVGTATQIAGDQGVLISLPKEKIPNLKYVPQDLILEHSAPAVLSFRGIYYRKDMVPFDITKWEDLWDPRLKNKIAVPNVLWDSASFLVTAALLAGGNEENIEPGFKKVESLKPNICMFFNQSQEQVKLVQTGEAAVAAWAILANTYRAINSDPKINRFVIPDKPYQFAGEIYISAVKGRHNEAAAAKFINFFLSADSQFLISSKMGLIPVNSKAKVSETLTGLIPPPASWNIYKKNHEAIKKNMRSWADRWNREIKTR